MGEEYATIFEAHQLIASDPAFTNTVEDVIRSQRVNAGWAIDQVLESLISRFEALPDAYLADRKLDVVDVATQILRALHGIDLGQLEKLDHPVILVADDLPPSAAVQLPLEKILGFALELGGPTSHTTIIARSLGIPVIVGVQGACEQAKRSRSLALDAFEGKIVFDPDPAELAEHIRATWFGSDLTDASLEQLAAMAREYESPARTRLLREGDDTKELSILVDGRIALTEHVAGRGSMLHLYNGYTGEPDFAQQDLDRYTSVTAESLSTWTNAVLDDSKRIELIVRPAPKEEAPKDGGGSEGGAQ